MGQRAATTLHNTISKGLSGFSFIQWHYCYFITTTLIASVILWGSSTPAQSVKYIDSLFLCVSAMTEAGLNTVNLSELNTWQQIMMFLLILFGSAIFVSSSVLHIRKRAFENKFAELVEQRRKRQYKPRTLVFSLSKKEHLRSNHRDAVLSSVALRGRQKETDLENGNHKDSTSSSERQQTSDTGANAQLQSLTPHITGTITNNSNTARIRFVDSNSPAGRTRSRSRNIRHSPSFFEGRGVGARGLDNHPRNARPMGIYEAASHHRIDNESAPSGPRVNKVHRYIGTVGGFLGRNSTFHHLSEQERRKLGGIEYDAICLLSWLVPMYFLLFQLFGALGVGAWITANHPNASWTNG